MGLTAAPDLEKSNVNVGVWAIDPGINKPEKPNNKKQVLKMFFINISVSIIFIYFNSIRPTCYFFSEVMDVIIGFTVSII
ncbi:MAG: hypothetical protein ABI761_12970 [Saprospiraceae bacterium]